MLVSIVIPVHGKVPFLYEAVSSVLEQEFKDWEMIIVLDRPSPELLIIAEQITRNDNRLKFLISPGNGIVDALNFGIENANGRLIARLDSDDVMEVNRLNAQVKKFADNDAICCVGSQMQLIDSNGKEIGRTFYPCDSYQIKRTLEYQNCIGHPAVMFKKESVKAIGGYRKALTGAEDYDLWIRLSKEFEIINLPEILTRYRVYPEQYSKTFGSTHTILEDAARLDSDFKYIEKEAPSVVDHEQLRMFNRRIRMQNLIRHPIKVSKSVKGLLVSKILRIGSLETSKSGKIFYVIPFAIILAIFSPSLFFHLAQKKLRKGRDE